MSGTSTTTTDSRGATMPARWKPHSPWPERSVRAVARHNLVLYSLALVSATALLWKRRDWQAAALLTIAWPALIGFSILNGKLSRKRLQIELESLRAHLDQAVENLEYFEELEDQQLHDLVDLCLDLLHPQVRRKLNRVAESARLQIPLPCATELAMSGSGSAMYNSLRRLKNLIRSEGNADGLRRALPLFIDGLAEELDQLRNDADAPAEGPDKGRRSSRKRAFALVTLLTMGVGVAILKFQGRLAGTGLRFKRGLFPRGGAPGA